MADYKAVHKAVSETLASLESDGVIEFEPLFIKQGPVTVDKDRRTVSFLVGLGNLSALPYCLVHTDGAPAVERRLRDAILSAMEGS